MCLVIVLKHKGVTMLANQHPTPPNGPLFPMPYHAPGWMGYNAASQDAGQGSGGQFHVAQGLVMRIWMWMLNWSKRRKKWSPLIVLVDSGGPGGRFRCRCWFPGFWSSGYIVQVPLAPTILTKVTNLPYHIPTHVPLYLSTYLSILVVSLDLVVPSYISDEQTLIFLAPFYLIRMVFQLGHIDLMCHTIMRRSTGLANSRSQLMWNS